jgi:broad specificity phosphatase PhoE
MLLVRHGETDANRSGLLLGRADPPLNERGLQQADALAAALHSEPDPLVVSSPLARAQQTATRIAAATGAPLEIDPRLVELDYGEWDGRRVTGMPADVAARWRADPTFAPPGGESLVDLRARVAPCEARLRSRIRDGTAIVVSHVSPIKAMILVALDLGDAFAWRLRLDVASISRVAPGPSGPVLVTFNETGHLR